MTVEKLVLTRKMVIAGMSDCAARGGWTKRQLSLIGVSWPPRAGWLKQIDELEPLIEKPKYEEFLRLKNSSKKMRKINGVSKREAKSLFGKQG